MSPKRAAGPRNPGYKLKGFKKFKFMPGFNESRVAVGDDTRCTVFEDFIDLESHSFAHGRGKQFVAGRAANIYYAGTCGTGMCSVIHWKDMGLFRKGYGHASELVILEKRTGLLERKVPYALFARHARQTNTMLPYMDGAQMVTREKPWSP